MFESSGVNTSPQITGDSRTWHCGWWRCGGGSDQYGS